MVKVYCTSKSFGQYIPHELRQFKLKVSEFKVPKKELDEKYIVEKAEVLILGTEKIPKIIEKSKYLKLICRIGKGNDNIPFEILKKKKISLFNTKTSLSNSVAELVLGLTFNLIRNISFSDNSIKKSHWKKKIGKSLTEINFSIIGFGEIGKELSKLLLSLNVKKIFVYDPYVIRKDKVFDKKISFIENFEDCLSRGDIISIHMPLTEETKFLFNKDTLSKINPNSFIINTSRGDIISEKDLIKFLKSNKIAGAALDVFSKEPYYGELINLDNVILSPHQGSFTLATRKKMELEIIQKILNINSNNITLLI